MHGSEILFFCSFLQSREQQSLRIFDQSESTELFWISRKILFLHQKVVEIATCYITIP